MGQNDYPSKEVVDNGVFKEFSKYLVRDQGNQILDWKINLHSHFENGQNFAILFLNYH